MLNMIIAVHLVLVVHFREGMLRCMVVLLLRLLMMGMVLGRLMVRRMMRVGLCRMRMVCMTVVCVIWAGCHRVHGGRIRCAVRHNARIGRVTRVGIVCMMARVMLLTMNLVKKDELFRARVEDIQQDAR